MKTKDFVRNITPEKAQQILLENGVKVSLEKAALALDLLYTLAILEVNENKQK